MIILYTPEMRLFREEVILSYIEIFTGPGCTQCAAAKAVLGDRGLSYVEHNVAEASALAAFRERLPRAKAIPQIFVDGEHIGGLEDLRLALERGTLST